MPNPSRRELSASVALLAVTAVWGSTFFLIRDVVTRLPVADLLAGRDIPFVFTSGHERDSLPMRFKERPLLSKPYVASQLQATLLRGLAQSEPDRPRAA